MENYRELIKNYMRFLNDYFKVPMYTEKDFENIDKISDDDAEATWEALSEFHTGVHDPFCFLNRIQEKTFVCSENCMYAQVHGLCSDDDSDFKMFNISSHNMMRANTLFFSGEHDDS